MKINEKLVVKMKKGLKIIGSVFIVKSVFIIFIVFLFAGFDLFAQEVSTNNVSDLEKYSKALKSEKPKDRLDAIYKLSVLKDPSAEEMLINAYKTEKDAYLKTQIIEALSVKNSTTSAAFIIEATNDSNVEVRKAAWISSAQILARDKKVAKAAADKLKKEKNKSVKLVGLNAFSINDDSDTIKLLGEIAGNSAEDLEIRKMALKKLSEMKTKEAKTELLKISKVKDKEIADEAAKLLNKK
jgi:HEAT repeat protein